eukprot:jgi/Psemu1/40807/gm1.40807_g
MPANPFGGGNSTGDGTAATATSFPSFDSHMKLILITIFKGGLREWPTFLDKLIKPDFARELTYMETTSGLPTQIHRSIQRTIEALAEFLNDLRKNEKNWKDVTPYTYDSFSTFHMARALRLQNESVLSPPAPPPGTNKKSPQQVKYKSWCQKSRDEKSFTPLTNDSRFEHWLVGFKAKFEAYGIDTETFLDETWPPAALQGYTRDLFVKQCAFFWVLMLEVFKSDLSASCVHSHSLTRNGRQAYFDFVNLHSKSTAKVYDNLTQLQALLKLNLSNWKESKVKFITHWFEELNHLNKLRPPNKPLEYHTAKSALCQACYSSFQLSEQFAKVKDPGGTKSTVTDAVAEATAIHKLKITLLLEATQLDSQAAMLAPKSTIRAHVHDFSPGQGQNSDDYALPIEFEGDYQDYAVFKAGRSPDPTTRLPTGIWKALSRQDMKSWRNFSPEGKKIGAYTHGHSVSFLEDDTSSSDTHTNASADLHPAVENDHRGVFHASLGVYKSQTSSLKDQRPLKSSVSPAHPARFLSENPDIWYKKDGDTQIPVGKSSYSVNFHQWYNPDDDLTFPHDNQIPSYTYRAHKATVTNPGFAMVDRGANGCIIGNDACLISKDIPPRYVNVTGINNHQVQNIPIATCGAYSVSNRGPIILIFNECAWKHISPMSMTHPSKRVVGRYTTFEFDTLPHVIMTSDKHWDPSVLDTTISAKDETFLQKYSPQSQQLPYPEYDEYGNPRCLEGLDISVSPGSSTVTSLSSYSSHCTQSPFLPIDDHGTNDCSFWLTPTDYAHQERLACCISPPISETVTAFPTDWTVSDAPRIATTPCERYPNKHDYLSLKPFFCWVSTDCIKATFDNSTQYGSLAVSPGGNIFKRFHSPQPAMNVRPFNDGILSEVVYSNVPAIDGGSKLAQIFFGRKSHIIHVEEMRTTGDFLSCFQNFVRKWGRPLCLLCDHGNYQSSKRVIDYLKMLWIGLWQSEPYHQHQNQFERRYQTFKRIVNCVMDRTGTPPHLWLLCMTYVAGLLNVISDPTLPDKQPIFIATDQKKMNAIHQIWMTMDKLNKGFYNLAEEDERWIDFKQHWNTSLMRLFQAVPLEEFEDVTENRNESSRQARRHKKATEGDESVIARSEAYMNTKPHENYMTKLQDGEKKQKIEDVLNNISKITFTPSGDSRGGKKYFKEFEAVWSKGASDCCYEIPQAVKMEKAIQGFFKLNLQKEDLNKAYAEWMEIVGTLEKDKRELEGMVDNIWKLKFCPKKGVECYFREFDAIWEATLTMCDYEVPIEIYMQKATCAILIAKLPWNVTKKANLEWWNEMDLTDNEVRYKRGNENEDDTDPLFPENDDDSDIDKDEKVNDGRDEIKALHGWNKACKRCADKKAKRKCRYFAKRKKTLKDDNPETLPPIKIERIRRNAGNYKEVSSDDNSNENGKAEEDTEERNEHTEEEDRENKEGADPLAVGTNQELQKGDTDNIEEKAANGTDASEKNEREEKQKTWKDYLQMLPLWC